VLCENNEHKSLGLSPKQLDLSQSLQTSTAILLLTGNLGHPCTTFESGSLIDSFSFSFEHITWLGDMVEIRELNLSNTELFLVESTIFGLLFTTDSGATVVQDLIVETASLSFVHITVLGGSTLKPNSLLSAPTSAFLVTTGLLLTDELGMIASTSGFLVSTGLLMTGLY